MESNSWRSRLTTNWHIMRILWLAIGLYMLGGAFYQKEWVMGIAGAYFLVVALTNTSCCGSAGCRPNSRTQRHNVSEV